MAPESAIRVVSPALSYMAVDMFKNFRKIGYVRRPVCIIHGTVDEVGESEGERVSK